MSAETQEQAQIDEMLRICRGALLEIRDWQGERDGQIYRTPEGFKGSPFDYLRKLANDGLKASARIACGIEPVPTPAQIERETKEACAKVADEIATEHGNDEAGEIWIAHRIAAAIRATPPVYERETGR